MSTLAPSVLPLVPSVFSAGDRISFSRCVLERDASGDSDQWLCTICGPAEVSYTDETARRLFVAPALLARNGVPLFAPAAPRPNEPLPGRLMAMGERPFTVGTAYLMCATDANDPESLVAVRTTSMSFWGTGQLAFVSGCGMYGHEAYELSLTDAGTIFLRIPGTASITLAYVPAVKPTAQEAAALTAYAAQPFGTVEPDFL
ncbi:hypothetical protein ABZ726_18245 [Streptomyces hundungensis]|uniref:hypothetical protein n=1 Tax=Streptomyces hundungensis TaxID=1077946 RepID=UPI003403B7DB